MLRGTGRETCVRNDQANDERRTNIAGLAETLPVTCGSEHVDTSGTEGKVPTPTQNN